ncbi:MAG: ABC transporter substrate-binding protein [bacterium]|nr:ABC transporter substrate-binding protein [bacterium]
MESIRRPSVMAVLLTIVLLITAWPAVQPGAQSTAALAAPAGDGRVVRMRYSRDPRTLEPGLFLELITGYISKDLHAGLLRFDDKMQPAPFIARRWTVSRDGLTYTFTLRNDVKFHNGRRVVASDFVYTFTRMLTPRVRAAAGPQALGKVRGARDYMDGKAAAVEGLQAPSDTTFRIVLAEPDPSLLLRLSTVFLSVIPAEAVVDGEPRWRDKPVGAGAFRFVEWQPQVRVVLEANPDYFLGRPRIDRIENYTVPDVATAVAQYQKGELDIIDVRGPQLAHVNSDPTLKKELKEFPRAQLLWFGMNQRRVPAFRDKRVRQAFVYALHRQALIEKVMLNDRYLATGFVPTGIPEAVPGEQAYPHDPTRARQLLAEAGFPGGRGFPRIEVVSTADETILVEAIVAQLKNKLGIDAVVRIGESGDVLSGMWAKDKWDMWSWGWSADRPSAEVWLYELMYGGLESNFIGYNNPEYNRLVDQARSETDPQKRVAAWRDAAKLAHEEVPYVPFGFAKFLYLIKPHVKGFSADLLGPKRLEKVEVVR